jgi:membrane-bound ClpP family serine protease
MVGRIGETVTTLNPSGIVRIDGHRLHCQSEGGILEAGTPVRVISARSNSVTVRRIDPNAPGALLDKSPAAPPANDEPLDFDLA